MSSLHTKDSSTGIARPEADRERDPSTAVATAQVLRGHTRLPRRVTVQEGHSLWAQTYDREPNPLLALEERELEDKFPT